MLRFCYSLLSCVCVFIAQLNKEQQITLIIGLWRFYLSITKVVSLNPMIVFINDFVLFNVYMSECLLPTP